MVVFEETFLQGAQGGHLVLLADKERDVVVAATVGNHPDGYVMERIEGFGLETAVVPFEVADHAYDHHVAVDGDGADFFQLIYDMLKFERVVYGDRHPDLACGDHVYRAAVIVENLKHAVHEARREHHPRRPDFDGDDVILGRHGLDALREFGVVDEGAFRRRLHGVEESNRYIVDLGRQHACRVEDLCPEIGQLGGLVEVEFGHRGGALDKTGVVVVHPVYVGPDFDFLGHQRGPDD